MKPKEPSRSPVRLPLDLITEREVFPSRVSRTTKLYQAANRCSPPIERFEAVLHAHRPILSKLSRFCRLCIHQWRSRYQAYGSLRYLSQIPSLAADIVAQFRTRADQSNSNVGFLLRGVWIFSRFLVGH